MRASNSISRISPSVTGLSFKLIRKQQQNMWASWVHSIPSHIKFQSSNTHFSPTWFFLASKDYFLGRCLFPEKFSLFFHLGVFSFNISEKVLVIFLLRSLLEWCQWHAGALILVQLGLIWLLVGVLPMLNLIGSHGGTLQRGCLRVVAEVMLLKKWCIVSVALVVAGCFLLGPLRLCSMVLLCLFS